jgi:adiponectin receptor
VLFGALTIITNINSKLQGYKYRSIRTLAFVATGISVMAPLIHGLSIFGLDLMNKKAFTYTLVAKIGCLLSGTALYIVSLPFSHTGGNLILIHTIRKMRFPERRWPGKFDMCSSHSLMHILVVCAAVIQMKGYLEAFDYAYSNITCSAS